MTPLSRLALSRLTNEIINARLESYLKSRKIDVQYSKLSRSCIQYRQNTGEHVTSEVAGQLLAQTSDVETMVHLHHLNVRQKHCRIYSTVQSVVVQAQSVQPDNKRIESWDLSRELIERQNASIKLLARE